MRQQLKTIKGYDFYEATSVMQKAIRRGDTKIAGFFALELFHSNYYNYVWKRLLVISAEDCWGIITQEVKALYDSFMLINGGTKEKTKGRIFISKAIILLCEAKKSRDADHLQNLIYDKMDVDPEEINYLLSLESEDRREEVPEYAYDCHTLKGKRAGKTKADFFRDEFTALEPRQPGLFDNLVN